MTEEQKLKGEVSELYADLAKTACHDPHDPNIRFTRRCLGWCLRWRLERLAEINGKPIPRRDQSFPSSIG